MKLFSKILLFSFGIVTILIGMDQPAITHQEAEFERLIKDDGQALRTLVAKEQRGIYCPELYKAQESLQQFLDSDKDHTWIYTVTEDTSYLVGSMAEKNRGYNRLISIFNYKKNPKYIKDLPSRCTTLLKTNRYIANTYGSCEPYQDRTITPLHYLLAKYAEQSSPEENILILCETLLDANANPNARDDAGNTPLHHASTPEQVHLLCGYGAKLNTSGEKGRTPLLNSIRLCNWPVAKCLLEYGANPKKPDNQGNTPVYKALKKKSPIDFIQLLLKNGANCAIHNRKSKTVLDVITDDTTLKIIKDHILETITTQDDSHKTLETYMMFYDLYLKNIN